MKRLGSIINIRQGTHAFAAMFRAPMFPVGRQPLPVGFRDLSLKRATA
ncbi:MAG: hypothetical protein ACR2Q3_09150 [Woeseiaceae bacterium]